MRTKLLFLCFLLVIAGALAWLLVGKITPPLAGPVASSPRISSQSGSTAMPSVDPADPTTEGTPAFRAAQEASLEHVRQAIATAKAFVSTGIPDTFIEFCVPEAGFCFSHPSAWGSASWQVERECIDRADLLGFTGTFFVPKATYLFGASALSYAAPGACATSGREPGLLDSAPPMDTTTADTLIRSPGGDLVAVWYGLPAGMPHEARMIFTAPTGHPTVPRIAFVGPRSSDALTADDITTFLAIAHSYRAIPVPPSSK